VVCSVASSPISLREVSRCWLAHLVPLVDKSVTPRDRALFLLRGAAPRKAERSRGTSLRIIVSSYGPKTDIGIGSETVEPRLVVAVSVSETLV